MGASHSRKETGTSQHHRISLQSVVIWMMLLELLPTLTTAADETYAPMEALITHTLLPMTKGPSTNTTKHITLSYRLSSQHAVSDSGVTTCWR